MKILILGGAGFIGSHLVRRCLQEPDTEIAVVDTLDPKLHSSLQNLNEVLSEIEFIKGDINDAELMRKMVQGQDVIFNLAAQTSHLLCMEDCYFDVQVNCLGHLTVLEMLREVDKDRKTTIVYPSTSTVIGRSQSSVIDETHIQDPLDIYSANKGVAEKYYQIYHRAFGIPTVTIRLANIYGPYGKGESAFGFMNYFIQRAWNGEDVTVYGSGKQQRNVMYAADAADILFESAFNKRLIGGNCFAVHNQTHSVRDIAEQIVDVLGRGTVSQIDWPEERKVIEVGDQVISAAKLGEFTDWHPSYNLAAGLAETRKVLLASESS